MGSNKCCSYLLKEARKWPPSDNDKDGGPMRKRLLVRRFSHADLFKQSIHDLNHLVVDNSILRDRLLQRDRYDLVRAQRRHASKLAAMHHVDRAQSIACRQNPVKRTRRTAALDVSQHHRARFESCALLDLARQNVCNAAQLGVSEFVLAHILQDWRTRAFRRKLRALSHDDNRKIASALVPLTNRLGNFVDIKWPLRNQDHIRAASYAAVQCDPARIPSHNLNHHHAVVRFCRGVNAVDRLAHDIARCVESKGVVRSAKIIVDGLGHAHHLDPLLEQFLRNRQCVVTANRNQRVDFMFLDCGKAPLYAVGALRRIRTRRAQNRSTTRQNSAYRVEIERHCHVLDQTAPALHETDKFVVIMKYSFAYDRANDRIQSRTVAPAS